MKSYPVGMVDDRKLNDLARVDRGRAIEIGQKWYWTGEPCHNGHVTWRYVNGNVCRSCKRVWNGKTRHKQEFGASESFALKIDRHNEDARLHNELKEVWDD